MTTGRWGVIRYAPGTGWCPEADCAAFDGWYLKRQDAVEIYDHWCRQYPSWDVVLVQANSDHVRHANKAWERLIDRSILPDRTLCPLKRDNAPR